MALQAADKHLLSDRDPARGLLGPDAGARDETCEGGVPGLGLAGSEAAGVVESEGVECPLAEDEDGVGTPAAGKREVKKATLRRSAREKGGTRTRETH